MKKILFPLLTIVVLIACNSETKDSNKNLKEETPKSATPSGVDVRKAGSQIPESNFSVIIYDEKKLVENFHLLIPTSCMRKDSIGNFARSFRQKYCKKDCNLFFYDDKKITAPLIKVYPMSDSDYLKFADHFVAASTFETPESIDWFPYQDAKYKSLGGKNFKKIQ